MCSWILICLLCVLFVRPYFAWQSGGNERIAAYGVSYLTVCMLFSFGQMGQWVFDRFVIASGRSGLFLFTLSAASITNLILDPIFIFGMFGLPRMETLGAALATVIGQITGMIAGILINRRWNREIPFSFTLHPDMASIRSILKVGIPSTMVQILTSMVTIALNSILLAFSTTAVAVYGICSRIGGVVTVGVHGIDNGLIPIAAYNFGAKKWKRITDSIHWTLLYSYLFYLPFFLVLLIAPASVLRIFDASDMMLSIGVSALRILSCAWLLSIPVLVLTAGQQGLSQGTRGMLQTMLRQAVLPLLIAFGMMHFGNLNLIWLSFILAEAFVISAAVLLWRKSFREASADL